MINIAICDDDKRFIKYIESAMKEAGLKEEVTYYEYTSGEEFIAAFKEDINYSLLILDIQMEGIDGNQVAYEFRKKYKNCMLVFCSGVCRPTPTSFKVSPFRYLLKEFTHKTMLEELKEIIEALQAVQKTITIEGQYNGNIVKLKPEQIMYISIAKRGSYIHIYPKTMPFEYKGFFMTKKSVAELYEILEKENFAYAHNSYIVNMKYIKIKGKQEIELPNGEKLSVSRSKLPELRNKMAEYLEDKYN